MILNLKPYESKSIPFEMCYLRFEEIKSKFHNWSPVRYKIVSPKEETGFKNSSFLPCYGCINLDLNGNKNKIKKAVF